MKEIPIGSGRYKCRVPMNPFCNKPFLTRKSFPSMPPRGFKLLEKLGIAEQAYKFKWKYYSANAILRKLPPIIPEIFYAIKASTNVQVPDGSGNEQAYLHSYICGEDEKSMVGTCTHNKIILIGDLNSAKGRNEISEKINQNSR